MTRRIIKRVKAQRDLVSIGKYIKQFSLAAARRFLSAAERAFRHLAQFPELGSLWETNEPALVGLRAWSIRKFERYVIFYRPLPDGIEVVRVLHGAQESERLLEDSI
jgi:toxin ParE1/3/4